MKREGEKRKGEKIMYILHFAICANTGKIHLIKLVQAITDLSLKDAKEFTEEKLSHLFDSTWSSNFTLLVTEAQAGRYFLRRELTSSGYGVEGSSISFQNVEAAPTIKHIDLTNCKVSY